MKSIVYVIVGICLVALSACGGAGAPGEPVTKAEEVVGVWRRTKSYVGPETRIDRMHVKLEADGAMAFGLSPDKWDYKICSEDFAFEGTQFKVTETTCPGLAVEGAPWDWTCAALGEPSGVYEVQLLTNGNLKFIDAGDDCTYRKDILTLAEWEPVQ